jgi:predicted MFS family arabinose efflux permease
VTLPGTVLRPRATVAASTLATGLGAYLGFVPGFLAPVLQADLDLSRTALGILVGVFYGATGIGSPVAGRLTDRMGARRAVALDQVLVAVALVAGAAFPVYPVLIAGAVVAGFGYALTNAGTNLAVAVAVPSRGHGVALATKTAGVPALVAVSAPLAAAAGEAFGWRAVYLATVPVVLAVAAFAWWALPDGRSPRPTDLAAGVRALPRGFLWFPAAAFCLVAGSQPLYSWTVAYLHEAGGLALPLAGTFTACGSIAAVVAMVVVARRSDRAAASSRIPAVVALCLVTAAGEAMLIAGPATGVPMMVAGVIVATVAQLSAIGLMHAAVVAAAPHAVGRASGVTMAGYYVGALVGAPVFGAVVDTTGSYVPAWTMSLALVLCGAAAFSRCRAVSSAPGTGASDGGTSPRSRTPGAAGRRAPRGRNAAGG